MEEKKLIIIGNESQVNYYNLNKQFSTVKKVIITGEEILNSYENTQIKELVEKLKSTNIQIYGEILKDNSFLFEEKLSNELYKKIQDSLNYISEQYMDVQLKDYNFMNSVSNTKFNVVLRCKNFSITENYVEKGTFLSNISKLIKKYLEFSGNVYRLGQLDNFQIEIYESTEIYKHIFLKKDSNKLLLSAYFGFAKNEPIDFQIGSEFYLSEGQDFQFFKNKQINAILREHGNLAEKEIKEQEKVLSNDDLILINEKTKNIDDAMIECFIDAKNNLKILNISINETPLEKYTKNGFIIKKSNKNYDRISILTTQDNLDEETINPKYLLLKSQTDIKELLGNFSFLEKIDGIIITKNFFIPYLNKVGDVKNLDIIYIDKSLNKSLDEKINWKNIDIESSTSQNNSGSLSPFSQILNEQSKNKDELFEKLKNIDLSTPDGREFNEENKNVIENTVNSIIGSQNSSFNQDSRRNASSAKNSMFGDCSVAVGTKGALGMLANAALNQQVNTEVRKQEGEEEIKRKMLEEERAASIREEEIRQNSRNPFDSFGTNNEEMNVGGEVSQYREENTSRKDYFGEESMDKFSQRKIDAEISPDMNVSGTYSRFGEESTTIIREEVVVEDPQTSVNILEDVNLARYENVVATEIIGAPNLEVDAYYVDMNSISQVQGGKIYFLTINKDEMTNSNLNYVLPIGLNSPEVKNCAILINNINDYFLINEKQENVEYFVNLNEINDIIKEKFIDEIVSKVGPITLICMKKDLKIVSEKINKIKSIFVKDINSNDELKEVKREILVYEKNYLMRKY